MPSFAHLPLLFGPDSKRLSKRHGATSVEELREAGYLAEAVVNFLALLGWHFDSERELFTLSELIGLFSLERVNPAPAVFDAKKLEWMNGVYLRALPTFDLAERLTRLPARSAARRSPPSPSASSRSTPLAQEKIATLAEFEPLCAFLFGPVEIDEEAWAKVAGHERAAEILDADADGAGQGGLDASSAIEAALRGVCERARAQAARRLRPRARRRHGHEHLAGPVRERSRARARRVARAPARRFRTPVTRCATTAARAWATAENARPSREASAPSAAPAASARAGVRARAPGSAASEPSASWAARPAAGLPGARVRATSARVSPARRPPA